MSNNLCCNKYAKRKLERKSFISCLNLLFLTFNNCLRQRDPISFHSDLFYISNLWIPWALCFISKTQNGLHWYIAQSLNLKKVYSKSFYLITSYRTNFFLRKNLHKCSCTWNQNVFQSNGVPERVLNHVNNFALRKKSHLVFILSKRILNMLNLKA